jgi:conjugative transfer pilus assembly protein TraH
MSKIYISAISYFMIIVILHNICITNYIHAGAIDNLIKYAKKQGHLSSVNKGAVINDQRTGYITGGSVMTRGPAPQTLKPINIELPSFEFDACTGSFDLRLGGFSYIKGSELKEFLKKIAMSAGGYIVKTLIKTLSPTIDGILNDLEAITRDISQLSFDQCEMGKKLAGGIMSSFTSGKKQKCLATSTAMHDADDLFQASDKCYSNPAAHSDTKEEKEELKSMLPDNANLVWWALSKGNGSTTDHKMKELIMSISGSVILTIEDKTPVISILPSLIISDDLLERYLGKSEVGVVKIYQCDNRKKCLKPEAKKQNLHHRDALFKKVTDQLISITEKLYYNKALSSNEAKLPFSDEEASLIEYSMFPLINFIETYLANTSLSAAKSLIVTGEIGELICYEMLTNFIGKMLEQAKTAVGKVQFAQLDQVAIEQFEKNVLYISRKIKDKRQASLRKLNVILAMRDRLTQDKKVFSHKFQALMSND